MINESQIALKMAVAKDTWAFVTHEEYEKISSIIRNDPALMKKIEKGIKVWKKVNESDDDLTIVDIPFPHHEVGSIILEVTKRQHSNLLKTRVIMKFGGLP
jgi:hypothetical protein